MKLKDGMILNELNGDFYLVDSGIQGHRFNGMIKLNQTGAFIVKALRNDTNEEQIVDSLCETYQASVEDAREDVHSLILVLTENELIQS